MSPSTDPVADRLRDTLVVVTGAASGIGRALAVAAAAAGARLALADRDGAGLAATAQQAGGDVSTTTLDVADRQAVQAFAGEVAARGGADVLVNNAGMGASGRVGDLTLATLQRTMDVNFWGVVHGTQAFLPQLLARREAALANLSSTFGFMGVPGQAAYCASKFAVRGFTESLRHEVRGTGLTVTVVHPGGVRTGIAAHSRVDFPVGVEVLREALREWDAQTLTSPEDAAAEILRGIVAGSPRILIGDDARFIDELARTRPEGHDDFVDSHLRRGAIWAAVDAAAPPAG